MIKMHHAGHPGKEVDVYLKNRVEELRKERGLKQDEFAGYLRVSRQTVSAIENGKYNPSLDLAFQIAEFFGKTIEEIFLYENENDNKERKRI